MSAVPDETIVLRDKFVPHGRTVPTANGWSWIAAAWSIFRRAAGIWIGMVLTLAVIYTVLAVLPVIGAGSGAKLYADARVMKDGRSMSFVEAEAKNEDGTLVAKAIATVRVLLKEKS